MNEEVRGSFLKMPFFWNEGTKLVASVPPSKQLQFGALEMNASKKICSSLFIRDTSLQIR